MTTTSLFDSKIPFFSSSKDDNDDKNNDELQAVNDLVKEISIEDGEWGIEDYENNGYNNVVTVTLKNGKKFWAAFYTYSSLDLVRKDSKMWGEKLDGKYYSDPEMILIDKCSRKDIETVINHILIENNGTLTPEFTKCNAWYHPKELWSTITIEVSVYVKRLRRRKRQRQQQQQEQKKLQEQEQQNNNNNKKNEES